MPVDTSMYQVPQNDLVGQLSRFQALANAAQQNVLLRQAQQSQALGITAQQAELYMQRLGLVSAELARVYGADNGNPKVQHIIDGVSNLIAKNPGVFTKDFAAQALSDIPSEAEVERDPNAVRQWLLSKAVMTERGRQALDMLVPKTQPVDTGARIVYPDVNPVTNNRVAGMSIVKGLSPTEASREATIGYDARGNPIRGTQQQFITRAQGGNPIAGGGNIPAGTIIPGGAPAPMALPQGPASMPAAQSSTGIPVAPQPAQAVASGQEGIPVPVGAAEANTASAVASAQQGAELQKSAENTQARKAMLSNLEDDIKKFTSGPLAPLKGRVQGAYNEVAESVGLPKMNPEAVAAQEKFRKQAATLAQQQFQALGGTGAEGHLASAISANPNEALSNLSNRQIILMLKGNEDALAAKNSAWQAWKKEHGPASYGQFQEEFNKNYEPRAWQMVYMNPQERREMFGSLTPNERKQVLSALRYAESRGWIKPESPEKPEKPAK